MTENLQDQIKRLINKYDPVQLFGHGAPEDEYAGEARMIYGFIKNNPSLSADDFHEGIRRIFVSRFSEGIVNENPRAYLELATDIHRLTSEEV